ncbi:hypothetical protein HPB51_002090 [Rhipicephalus microplus]|uniref:Uncharacterized protein n=1 Tax=Rhipicephalus microplus TaxID=6941 RepID=A0A9J6E6E5_RHIMP|nr:hypothetical protein HPB51_002090 [Rhipicephalus microplus]
MLARANYGVEYAARFDVLTGQSQVHEPEVFIKKDSTITRLFNSSGVLKEDCGGLVQPTFLFCGYWNRGHIKFFASEHCVLDGVRYLILPSCFEQGGSFAEAAVYLVSLLPWPWDNMSIMLETAVDGDPTPQYDEPHLVQYPTMGPTAVAFWHLFSPIPVNFKLGKDHFVPASAFAASWALGYDVATINSVLAKIQVHGLFNNVGRWVFKAPSFAVSHAGIMATQKVQLIDVPAEEGSVKPLPPTILSNMDDDDDVLLLYRCWAVPGYRMRHIDKDVVWADVIELPLDGLITLPLITTLSAVN